MTKEELLLQHLQRAVDAPDTAETVRAVCAAWAYVPSSRLSKLAAALTRRLNVEPVPGANQPEREQAWHALAMSDAPDVLPRLLATPWSKQARDAQERLNVLMSRFGPDPRIATALLELDTGSRYPTGAGHRFWGNVYRLLLRWGSAEAADRIPRDARAFPDSSPWAGRRFVSIFEPIVVEWNERWPEEPELADDAIALIARLEARLAPQQRLATELLAAVHAAPHEDGPRLVFADALAEQGDPRGEFIAMQFAHARGELPMGERERMQRLLNASGRSWHDGLDTQVAPLSVFHKGFAHEVRMATRAPDAGIPAWRLVESLDVAAIATSLSDFLSHPHTVGVHSLRSLRGTTLQELARKGAARHFQLLEVGFLGGREFPVPAWTVDTLRLLAPIDESAWWLVGSSGRIKAKRVELQLTGSFERVGAVLRELETRAPDVDFVTFAARTPAWPQPWRGAWQLELTRVNGSFSRARVVLFDAFFEGLTQALASLPVEQLSTIEISSIVRRGPAWRDDTRRALMDVLEGQQHLEPPQFELLRPRVSVAAPVIYEGT